MEYIVQITELLSHRIAIEADSAEEAKQKIQDSYYNDDIELTADDYVDGSVQFEVVGNGRKIAFIISRGGGE